MTLIGLCSEQQAAALLKTVILMKTRAAKEPRFEKQDFDQIEYKPNFTPDPSNFRIQR